LVVDLVFLLMFSQKLVFEVWISRVLFCCFCFAVREMEPRALSNLSKCSTTEPHPSTVLFYFWDRVSLTCPAGLELSKLLPQPPRIGEITDVCHHAQLTTSSVFFKSKYWFCSCAEFWDLLLVVKSVLPRFGNILIFLCVCRDRKHKHCGKTVISSSS
jgi:hypothetical protein